MGRGKAFARPLERLVAVGAVARPPWLASVAATRPAFEPVVRTRPPPLEYPEDRLRAVFLQRNPDARRIPLNLLARNVEDRHVADKFVSVQMRLMEEDGLAEEEAYNEAARVLNEEHLKMDGDEQGLYGPLADDGVQDDAVRLYLASKKDSERDQALFRALVKQAKEIR